MDQWPEEWTPHDGSKVCPVDAEQRVMVRWKEDGSSILHRAGVFNWTMIDAYKLMPNKPHAR